MEKRSEASNISPFAAFGGGTAGPLTPPTLPFRFGKTRDEEFTPPPSSVLPRNGKSTRPYARAPGSNTYRRPGFEPPQVFSGFPRSGSTMHFVRGVAPARPGAPRSSLPAPRAPGVVPSRSPNGVPNIRPQGMVFNRLSRPTATNVQRSSSVSPALRPAAPGTQAQVQLSRAKSPPLSLEEQQREALAKERRRDRFKLEHSVTTAEPVIRAKPRESTAPAESMDAEDIFSDDRDWKSAEPILGLCPDMCSEVERAERERKGDLDHFERLGGDRNQTTAQLAVKKYTRTADKDATLIRPLTVLKSTMNYLLQLLDRGYGDDLLPLYNFLWDRMRAVRQDLRMQHIFNHEAIEMHEQMIRFHILAMHELCEYPKGEGFTEGFDAHLNIEQMNKTIVDLFLMYDQQRQQGTPVANEAEFRGYYSLLKLDKHPGYMVEPSELTAELAKMNPEMRNSDDVLFARKIASSYRLPNYISFFRLARKATYLQACLLHAHFSKLRNQALTILHSGLKSSQGIPLLQVTSWLGMEGQEMEDLLEYHGFSIKQFEEPYMVKEGAFLNRDQDYQTYRSSLVESRRSSKVIDDVVARKTLEADWSLDKKQDVAEAPGTYFGINRAEVAPQPVIVDEKLPDYEDEEMQDAYQPVEFAVAPSIDFMQQREKSFNFVLPPTSPPFVAQIDSSLVFPFHQQNQAMETLPRERKRQRSDVQEFFDHSPKRHVTSDYFEASIAEPVEEPDTDKEEAEARLEEERLRQEEALRARVKLFFKRWKLRTDAKIEAEKLRKEKAEAALSSMTLGFTLQETWKDSAPAVRGIDLQHVAEQRKSLLENLWGHVDVPAVIVPVLKEKYPQETAICWKVALCFGANGNVETDQGRDRSTLPRQWLRSKFFKEVQHDVYAAAAETYVSKNVIDDVYCCYIAKDVSFYGSEVKSPASLYGISAVLFLVLEDLTLQENCLRLHSIVDALPSRTFSPLLVLSLQEAASSPALEASLQLRELDGSKISSWSILPLTEDPNAFYSVEALISGIRWLASLASPQPDLRPLNLKDLVWEHLQRRVKPSAQQQSELEPAYYILMFNRALEDSAEELHAAARSCSSNWPPPEFGNAPEGLSVPYCGWNDPASLQPVFDALDCCRLPPFIFEEQDCFSLRSANDLLQEVTCHYKSLVATFAEYLSSIDRDEDSCQAQAAAESILREAACMDWSQEECRIVIDWRRVFQIIFQDRLMLLNSEPPAIVYVLRKAGHEVREEFDDYEKQLSFASKLRSKKSQLDDDDDDEVADRVKEGTWSQEEASTSAVFDDAEEDDAEEELSRMVAKELECARSEEEQKLLALSSRGEGRSVAFSATAEEARLETLIAKLQQTVEKSMEAVSSDGILGSGIGGELNYRDQSAYKESSRSSSSTEVVLWTEGAQASYGKNSSSKSRSSSRSDERLAKLLECCELSQLANYAKLAGYFGLCSREVKM